MIDTVNSMVDALRTQPLALALVVVNILFLASAGWGIHEVSSIVSGDREARTALFAQMLANCAPRPP